MGNGFSSNIQNKRVDKWAVVLSSSVKRLSGRKKEARPKLQQKGHRCTCLQIGVQFLLKVVRSETGGEIGEDARWLVDLRQQVHFQVGREGIRQAHLARK